VSRCEGEWLAFQLELGWACFGEGVLLDGFLVYLEMVHVYLAEAVDAEFNKALRERCVRRGLWKVIFGGCCYCVLFNHQDSPIFNKLLVSYLSVVHVHLAQYNKQ